MEGPEMEENNKESECEAHLSSVAAFVEGGIQDPCDDACSICLEAFCDTDPSTVTSCKHEFHLQCILEWCQRSSQCPMCWQAISLKDSISQELLVAVERERNFRFKPSRNATIFHNPTLGDFELHLPVGVNDADLEERIIQHSAAAAAMGRARHFTRREGQRNRSLAQGHPHFLVFSAHPNSPLVAPASSSSPTQMGDGEPTPAVAVTSLSPTPATAEELSQLTSVSPVEADQVSVSGSRSIALASDHQGSSYNDRRSPSQSSPSTEDRAGPSEFQSFSESLKSRLNAVSMRYKESISKSTRGWKERWFSRNTSMSDLGSEVRREVNEGIATMSRMMERLETGDSNRTSGNSAPSNLEDGSVPGSNDQHLMDTGGDTLLRDNNTKASCAAGSSSN